MDSANLQTYALIALVVLAVWWYLSRPRGSRYAGYYDTYGEDEDYESGEEEGFAGYDEEEGFAQQPGGPVLPLGSNGMTSSVDLLPAPAAKADNWSEFSPGALTGQNFLQAPLFIGTDTVGSTLKNANYDLRAAIPVAKASFVWNNSTIDADVYRRPLEGL